jgi:hypothetical protein
MSRNLGELSIDQLSALLTPYAESRGVSVEELHELLERDERERHEICEHPKAQGPCN